MELSYAQLRKRVRELQKKGALPVWPSDEQRADWAFGNTAIENDNITREMAQDAVATKPSKHRR
jgi:hypothetical protein